MRRSCAASFFIVGFLALFTPLRTAHALTESDISTELSTLRGAVTTATATVPLDGALSATCGGLLFGSDPRLEGHQIRSPTFSCDLLSSCSLYQESDGECIGYTCEVEECADSSCAGRPYWLAPDWYDQPFYWPYRWGWPYWPSVDCKTNWGCERAVNCTVAGTGCTLTPCQGRCGKLSDCTGGSCTPVIGADSCGNTAPRSCTPLGSVALATSPTSTVTIDFSGPRSSRKYRCDNTAGCIFNPSSETYTCGTGVEGQYRADIQCYTFSAPIMDSWYHPNAFNCRATFDNLPSNPPGEAALNARVYAAPLERTPAAPWQAVQRSTLACAESDVWGEGHDASILKAASDQGVFTVPSSSSFIHYAVTDWWPDPWNTSWYSQYGGYWYVPKRSPDLSSVLTELRNPPEVRLILPMESLGFPFGTRSKFLQQISPRLAYPETPSPVMLNIASVPDVLEVAADVVRSLPLLRVEFLPVDVLLPHVEEAEIQTLIKDWEHWLFWAQEAASAPGADPDIATRLAAMQSRIDNPSTGVLARLQEYLVILREVRRYRSFLPTYLDAILSATEKANAFYTAWLTENAIRLQGWRTVQEYLPVFAEELRALHEDAMEYVDSCLTPACIGAMPGVPVASDTLPWEVFGEVAGVNMVEPPLNLRDRAYLPGAWRVWENTFGRFGYRNPRNLAVGTPLADLTIDFSSLPFGRRFSVPFLRVSLLPLDLPHPPDAPITTREDIPDPHEIRELPEIILPDIPLSVPPLTFPDPGDSLFFIPDPPRPLGVSPGTPPVHIGSQLISWERDRLATLSSEACFNPGSKSYLISEAMVAKGARWWDPVYGSVSPEAYSSAAIASAVSRPATAFALSTASPPWCMSCALLAPQQEAHQAISVDAAWEDMQREVLHLADEWNAQIRFLSVTSRSDLEGVEQMMRWTLVSGNDPLLPSWSFVRASMREAALRILQTFPSLS